MPDMSIVPETAPQPLTPQPAAYTPSAFGGDVAQAMTGAANMAGEQIMARHRMDLKNYADAENADGQVRIANLRDQMAAAQADVQKAAQGGGLDPRQYHDAMIGKFDELSAGLASGANSAAVQRQLNAQLGVMRAEVSTQARDWQTVNLANQANLKIKEADAVFDQQSAQPAPYDQFMQVQNNRADLYHGLADLSEDQKHALTIQGVQRGATLHYQSLAQIDGPQTITELQNGMAEKAGLPGEQFHIIARAAQVDIDRRNAAIRAQQRAAEQQVIVAAESAKRTIDGGGSIPLPQLMAQEQQVRALGPEHAALADDLLKSGVTMQVNAQFGAEPPQAVAALAQKEGAKIAALQAAGKPVSLEQGAHAQALDALAKRIGTAASSDQWSLAAERGIVPTPLDWNDPHAAQVLAARIPQAQALARGLGPGYVMQPLQKPEAAQLKDILSNGSSLDRMRVLSGIAAQEDHAPGSTAAIFNQVQAPPEMRWAAGLMTGANPQGVQAANDLLTGYSALQKMPELVSKKSFDSIAAPLVGGALGSDLAALAGNPHYIGLMAGARAIYAAEASAHGHAQGEALVPLLVSSALNKALGGYKDSAGIARGGLGFHNGVMALPDGASQQEFDAKQAQVLPGALMAAGVKVPMSYQRVEAPSLRAVQAGNPIKPGESQWDYQQRIGHIQWQGQTRSNDRMVPDMPGNIQFRAVGGDKYKLWTGTSFIADPKGRAAVWDYRTGKVSF